MNNSDSTPSYTDDNVNYDWNSYPNYPNYYQPVPRHIKRVTKTIEKYGPNGEYLGKEVITIDKEDIVEQVYDYWVTGTERYPGTITTGEGTIISDGTVTYKNNDLFTYTSFSASSNDINWSVN